MKQMAQRIVKAVLMWLHGKDFLIALIAAFITIVFFLIPMMVICKYIANKLLQ
jgi:hypothetical protein